MTSDVFGSSSVSEVTDFVLRSGVLAHPFLNVYIQRFQTVRVITEFDSIDSYRDPDLPNSNLSGDMAWVDIQRVDEHLSPTLHEVEKWKRIEAISAEIYSSLTTQFESQIPEYEIQEMSGQLEHLVFLRSTVGVIDCFHEDLFKIYKAGGYPCGWAGAYPEGELVVYSRPAGDKRP